MCLNRIKYELLILFPPLPPPMGLCVHDVCLQALSCRWAEERESPCPPWNAGMQAVGMQCGNVGMWDAGCGDVLGSLQREIAPLGPFPSSEVMTRAASGATGDPRGCCGLDVAPALSHTGSSSPIPAGASLAVPAEQIFAQSTTPR